MIKMRIYVSLMRFRLLCYRFLRSRHKNQVAQNTENALVTRIVIVGATSLISEQAARIWVGRGRVDLTLVGRDMAKLEHIAVDLKIRSPELIVESIETDFVGPSAIQQTVNLIAKKGPIDIVLIAHGSLPLQENCQSDLSVCHQALEINAISPVLFAEAFAGHLAHDNRGTLAVIGSVAGDRGRKSNYVYGAAKGLLSRYMQGLQHRFAATKVNIVLIKPGPTDTPMTASLKAEGKKLASAEQVAQQMVKAIDKGMRVAYVPRQWQLVMGIVKLIPAPIFNRLNI